MSLPIVSSSPTTPESPGREFDFLTWFEVNKKLILALLGAVVLAVIVLMVLRWKGDQAEAEASRALLAAATPATPGAAVSSQAFLQVAEKNPGTHAAERARLLAAGQLFAEGKFADAQTQFEKFVADFAASPLLSTALLGTASALDAQNKKDAALTAYQGVITGYGKDAVATQARLALARLHEEAGQGARALALYDELAKDSGGLGLQQVMIARARLLQLHPELEQPAGTNAFVAPAAPALPAR